MVDILTQFYEALKREVKGSPMKIYSFKEYENVLCRVAKARQNDFCNLAERQLTKIYKVAMVDGKNRIIPASNGSTRIVSFVYLEEIYSILNEAHIRLNHGDCRSMYTDIKSKYVNITFDMIQLYLSFCKVCQQRKNSLDQIMYLEMNSRCHLDIIDVKPHFDGDYKYILCYEDYKSKYCFLRPLKSVCPKEVSNIVVDIFTTIGAPNIIQTNRGSRFTHSLILLLIEMWPDLRIVPGQSTHDDNDTIRDLVFTHKGIKSFGDYRWTKVLGFIQIKKNRTFNAEIQQTPFEAMFGRAVKIGLFDSVVSKKDIASLQSENDLRTILCCYVNDKCTSKNKSSDDEEESPSKNATVKEEASKKDDTKVKRNKKESPQGMSSKKSGYFMGYDVESGKDTNKKTKRDVKENEKIVKAMPNSPVLRGRRKKIKLQEVESAKDIEVVYINEKPPVRINSKTIDDPLIDPPNTKKNRKIIKEHDVNFNNNNLFKTNNNPVIIISEKIDMKTIIENVKLDHSYVRTVVDDDVAANNGMDVDKFEAMIDDSNISLIKTTEDIEDLIFANTLHKGPTVQGTTKGKGKVPRQLKKLTNQEVLDLKLGSKKERLAIQAAPDDLPKGPTTVKTVADAQPVPIHDRSTKKDKKVQTDHQITKRVTRSSTRAKNISKLSEPITNTPMVTKLSPRYGKHGKSIEQEEYSNDMRKLNIACERLDIVKKELIDEVNLLIGESEDVASGIEMTAFESLQHTAIPIENVVAVYDEVVDDDLSIYGNLVDPITGNSTVDTYFVGCSCPRDCKKNNKCPCKLKSMLCNVKCHNNEQCMN